MNVDFPDSLPDGFDIGSSGEMSDNHPVSKEPVTIRADVVIFGFSSAKDDENRDPIRVTVELFDSELNGLLGSGSLDIGPGEGYGEKYIRFSGFPLRATGTEMSECTATITLTNLRAEGTGTAVWYKVY